MGCGQHPAACPQLCFRLYSSGYNGELQGFFYKKFPAPVPPANRRGESFWAEKFHRLLNDVKKTENPDKMMLKNQRDMIFLEQSEDWLSNISNVFFRTLCAVPPTFETCPVQVEILRQRSFSTTVLGPVLDNGPFLFGKTPFWKPKTGLCKKEAAPGISAGSATSCFSWRLFVVKKLQNGNSLFCNFCL